VTEKNLENKPDAKTVQINDEIANFGEPIAKISILFAIIGI
jgi:hypothetical protein